MSTCTIRIKNLETAIIGGGIFEDVLGLEDVLENTF